VKGAGLIGGQGVPPITTGIPEEKSDPRDSADIKPDRAKKNNSTKKKSAKRLKVAMSAAPLRVSIRRLA
jgi:hypothetical protein